MYWDFVLSESTKMLDPKLAPTPKLFNYEEINIKKCKNKQERPEIYSGSALTSLRPLYIYDYT